MGLRIEVYRKDITTGRLEYLPSEVGDVLGGPEATRTDLWGSEVVKSLGIKILSSLSHSDIYVDADELIELEGEVNSVRNNIDLIASKVTLSQYSISVITQNILTAIERAKKVGGGIVIS